MDHLQAFLGRDGVSSGPEVLVVRYEDMKKDLLKATSHEINAPCE